MSTAITIGADDSISGSLQGIEIKTFNQLYQGMSPKIRPINNPIVVLDGTRIDNLNLFDEGLISGIDKKKVEQFPNFEIENSSFGMPKDFRDEAIFEDMDKFDPVKFIQDNGSSLIYPQVLWNLSAKDIDSYDGVIEPLTIRSRASRNSIEWPYDSHDVRAALSNAAEDIRRRGNLLIDYIFQKEEPVEAYLDEQFGHDTLEINTPPYLMAPITSSHPFLDGTDWEDSANNLQGEIRDALLLSRESTEQMFPRGANSSTSGQIVNLQESVGTDSIAFVGMKR